MVTGLCHYVMLPEDVQGASCFAGGETRLPGNRHHGQSLRRFGQGSQHGDLSWRLVSFRLYPYPDEVGEAVTE